MNDVRARTNNAYLFVLRERGLAFAPVKDRILLFLLQIIRARDRGQWQDVRARGDG